MDRITERDLQAVCDRINVAVNGAKLAAYSRDDDGRLTANIGAYVLDGAYGGWELHRMATAGGGVSDVFFCGHVPKRELYGRMQAFLRGLEAVGS